MRPWGQSLALLGRKGGREGRKEREEAESDVLED
jgi:hypothetical protein